MKSSLEGQIVLPAKVLEKSRAILFRREYKHRLRIEKECDGVHTYDDSIVETNTARLHQPIQVK